MGLPQPASIRRPVQYNEAVPYRGARPAEVILEHTMASYGFASLEQAEEAQRKRVEE